MIKLNKPEEGPTIPHATTGLCRLIKAKDKIIERYDNSEKLVFNPIYRDEIIKKELMVKVQKNKCCYCEKLIFDDFEVEHFRPKEAVIHNGKLENPGYYWLTYDWDNLLYSCNKCNKKKGNNFPLKDEAQRARNHNMAITNELPLLLNPSAQDPEDYLEFLGLEIVAKPGVNNEVAIKTLDTIKLQRDELFHLRCEKFFQIRDYTHNLYEMVKDDEELELEARVKCIEYLESKTQNDQEFSMLIRHNYDKLRPNLI